MGLFEGGLGLDGGWGDFAGREAGGGGFRGRRVLGVVGMGDGLGVAYRDRGCFVPAGEAWLFVVGMGG
jgi:hypothetical protein